ncbi:histidine phosphatase superfamily [Xylariales sp. PMI_506]|nr:histidine phosphatase superfamily [Xylariales sp. PMI_506]
MGVLLGAVVLYYVGNYMRYDSSGSCDSATQGFHCEPKVSQYWGQYSPYYSINLGIPNSTPDQCKVSFVQILSRHGARDPTLGKTLLYGALVSRIQSSVTKYGKHFQFIKNYNYTLGADQLSDFGRQQMVNSGIKFYQRYEDLTQGELPFLRSAGQERVVESAVKWAEGFHQARMGDTHFNSSDDYPYNILVIPEEAGVNNTLSGGLCTAFESGSNFGPAAMAQAAWLETFAPPITERLNNNLPGANLSNSDTIAFMELCPFETVANKDGRLSRFCHLFTNEEWHGYDYYESLGKWYGYSNGNPLGPTQGVGFVNELIARLTGQPVQDHTTTNSTLDDSPATFPLDKTLYADFSHDNDMLGIFAAMGLYNLTEPLSNTTRQSPRQTNGFSASWAVPFAARMYVEKLSCSDYEEELVRVLVNDRVIHLQNCDADKLGRCTVSKFVESLSFAREGGYWDLCFE